MNSASARWLFLWACVFSAGLSPGSLGAAPPERKVAVTIDDLPAASADAMDGQAILDMTAKLLTALQEEKVPVVGFVNEKKLFKLGEVDQRIKALQMWVDAGFELGNHTFSHASLNRAGLKEEEDEVIRGETVTRMLLEQKKMKLRYFRHPYLDTGRDLKTRRDFEAFLVERGYTIAPITLDAWDWNFAGGYQRAQKHGDKALEKEIVDTYFSYTNEVLAYSEKLSKQVVGYEPAQVLLLHANSLEADHLHELIKLIRKRGYRFIPLQEALSDQAYSLPDEYVGEEGTGWLDHWAITQGKPPQDFPVFPQAVVDKARALDKGDAQAKDSDY